MNEQKKAATANSGENVGEQEASKISKHIFHDKAIEFAVAYVDVCLQQVKIAQKNPGLCTPDQLRALGESAQVLFKLYEERSYGLP